MTNFQLKTSAAAYAGSVAGMVMTCRQSSALNHNPIAAFHIRESLI